MEHLDEQEMLIQYSEMTAFDFDSEEFQKVQRDYVECRNIIQNFSWTIERFFSRLKPVRN